MDITKNRNSIRSEILQKRDNITPAERTILSERIMAHLIEWIQLSEKSEQGYNFDSVMVFLSMNSEVDTWQLVELLHEQEKQIIAPVVDTKSGDLIPKQIQNFDEDLVLHRYGMYEPKESCPVFPTHQLQLILVPGIAFDRKGHRLGYGKGFYDRFLPTCPNAVTIGMAFQVQIVDDTYPQQWDIPVQHILTEVGIFDQFKTNKYECEKKNNIY